MTASRRLSQAISEGDGISLIVEVDGAAAARAAEERGADALLLATGGERRLPEIRESSTLPIVIYLGDEPAGAAEGADACVVDGEPDRLAEIHHELSTRFEVAIRIERDEQIAEALERFEPEIFVLAAEEGDARLEHVLDLLSDVPAGKLAVAELAGATRDEIAELERAGCDAVLVGAAGAEG